MQYRFYRVEDRGTTRKPNYVEIPIDPPDEEKERVIRRWSKDLEKAGTARRYQGYGLIGNWVQSIAD